MAKSSPPLCPLCATPVPEKPPGRGRRAVYCSAECRAERNRTAGRDRYRAENGVLNRRAQSRARAQRLRNLRAAGQTLEQIAQSEGLSRQRVHQILQAVRDGD